MFDLARENLRLRQLLRDRDKLSRSFGRDIKAAPTTTAKETLRDKTRFELDLADDEINKLRGSILIREANQYLLSLPSNESFWEESQIDGKRVLTQSGQRALLVAIREEKKERAELLRIRSAGWIGIIGALTGLAAVIMAHWP